jgi:hypothetical protein
MAGCNTTRTLDFNYQTPFLSSSDEQPNIPFSVGEVTDDRSQLTGDFIGALSYTNYTTYGAGITTQIPYQAKGPVADILQTGLQNYFANDGYRLQASQAPVTLTGSLYKINFATQSLGILHRGLNVDIESIFKVTDNRTNKVLWMNNIKGKNNLERTKYNTLLRNLPTDKQVIDALNDAMTALFENLANAPGFQQAIGLGRKTVDTEQTDN